MSTETTTTTTITTMTYPMTTMTTMTRARPAACAALLAGALLAAPAPAWASNFEGLWTVVYGMFFGVPYGIALVVLGIIGLVFVAKKQARPSFGSFLLIGPCIVTAVYLFLPLVMLGGRVARHFGV